MWTCRLCRNSRYLLSLQISPRTYVWLTLSSHPLQFLACVCVHVCTLVQSWTCVCVVIVFFVQILVSFPRMDLPYLLTWFGWVVVSIKILELSILSVSISFTIKDCVERFLDVVVYILYLLFLSLHLHYIISSFIFIYLFIIIIFFYE